MMEQTDKDMREITYEGIRNRWSEGGKGQVREGMEKYCPSRGPAFRCPQKKKKKQEQSPKRSQDGWRRGWRRAKVRSEGRPPGGQGEVQWSGGLREC